MAPTLVDLGARIGPVSPGALSDVVSWRARTYSPQRRGFAGICSDSLALSRLSDMDFSGFGRESHTSSAFFYDTGDESSLGAKKS